MTGRIIDFDANGSTTPGYLATPDVAGGPGIVVLHTWWGLTEPFRQVCDRLAEAGFVALAPDLYHGKSTAVIEEAQELGAALDQQAEQWRGDIRGALQCLRQNGALTPTAGRGAFGFVAFSLGGAYALDTSVELPDEVAAVATFYATYPGLDYRRAKATYLCHFAEDDPYESAELAAEMERQLTAAGRQSTFYTYPGTRHWFFEANRPETYDAAAAALAWKRTLAFLDTELRQP
jgi:carboxymethylenebutenolidase